MMKHIPSNPVFLSILAMAAGIVLITIFATSLIVERTKLHTAFQIEISEKGLDLAQNRTEHTALLRKTLKLKSPKKEAFIEPNAIDILGYSPLGLYLRYHSIYTLTCLEENGNRAELMSVRDTEQPGKKAQIVSMRPYTAQLAAEYCAHLFAPKHAFEKRWDKAPYWTTPNKNPFWNKEKIFP